MKVLSEISFASSCPSSGPLGHLLPASGREKEVIAKGGASSFAPSLAGRRWREAKDEGQLDAES
jgi:hypothetical protein